ncbi:erythromycin esterase family protein [Kitasatospora sp. NPDC057692]|uniref:erythromycin esterase family protein n=1 Tax=Kitasatospora sp. NPDC057692 TaxID=3346215 RepID=UPI0036B33865
MITHKLLLTALLVPLGATLAVAPAASASAPPATLASSASADAAAFRSPEAALDRVAHPLRTTEPLGGLADLRPFGTMVGDATVVGVGEATHSSHEFVTLKQRMLRYLVEEKGFRTFALEAAWSSGLRIDAYLTRGEGDLKQIMDEEFQGTYRWWNNAEYRDLLQWMRSYNIQHPGDPVHFVGDDNGFAGPELYDRVNAWAAASGPELAAQIGELYRGLRPATGAEAYVNDYFAKPLAERRELAERTARAVDLLKQHPGADADAHAWAVQHAAAIHQMTTLYAFDWDDPQNIPGAMLYRDRVMADNIAWWQQHTGDKIMISAHNTHAALKTYAPASHPRVQGEFLREQLGTGYLSVGLTFNQGTFNAFNHDGAPERFAAAPAAPGTAEHTLDRVRYRDYVVDLRNTPAPARTWLAEPHTIKNIGATYPGIADAPQIRLTQTHDILIHLHQVQAAHMLN